MTIFNSLHEMLAYSFIFIIHINFLFNLTGYLLVNIDDAKILLNFLTFKNYKDKDTRSLL